MGSTWLLAALFLTTNAELCATTLVILLYFLLQNSGNPLQGTVFVGRAELLVALAVPLRVVVAFDEMPPISVSDTDLELTVICEFCELVDVLVAVSTVPLAAVKVVVMVCTVLCPVGER